MQIELRQHEDGSYSLEVRQHNDIKEIDLTEVIREIVVDKLRALQTRLRLEEKYRDWAVETAQETAKAVSTARVRYEQMQRRLSDTNEAITEAIDVWRKQKDLQGPMMRLNAIVEQNEHFLQNDSTITKLEEVIKKG